ncbi:MAG: ribonuclease R [Verrucomicrobiota bacterium]
MDYDTIQQKVLGLLRSPDYRPLNKSEMARELSLHSGQRSDLRSILKDLEKEGLIMRAKRGRYLLCSSSEGHLVGRLRLGPRGHGHVIVESKDAAGNPVRGFPEKGTVFIKATHTQTALDGDRVVIQVQDRPKEPKWLERLPAHHQEKARRQWKREKSGDALGRVVRVLERKNRRIVGTLRKKGKRFQVHPDNPAMPPGIDIDVGDENKARPGDKVLCSIEEWVSRFKTPRGRVLRSLGPADSPGVDILTIIHKYDLPTDFRPGTKEAAGSISETIPEDEIARREDWREREVLTIDPFDAKDFDDAISVETSDDGGWELAVHIADVSHYVAPGQPLDKEASERGNSVYLVDRVIPMLPEALSNGICSLKPDVDRLTMAAIIRFDKKGQPTSVRYASAIIRSCCRLTYEQAYERMESGQPEDAVTAILKRAWSLASLLRRHRFREGGLDLDFPETKVILDEKGKPVELRRIEYDESHQLIEEFMLAANEAVARTLKEAGRPSLYRIHEDPDHDKLVEFQELVRQYGFPAGDLSHRSEMQKLLKKIRGRPEEHAIKLGLLKSLKRAVYAADPVGHYGLAKENYTHFTSPIRRYADLVVHRVLRKLIEQREALRTPKQKQLVEMGRHLSQTERQAAEAEMESKRLKVAEYFAGLIHKKPQPRFEALVHDIRRIGLFVELVDYQVKGLVKVNCLPPDDYRFEPRSMTYKGRHHVFGLGDHIQVSVVHVDLEKQFIDFQVASEP